jgi:hypothetical protein
VSIKEIVDDPEWQALRRSFLGTWKCQPEKNVAALKAYLGDASCALRLRRVHNYLTGSGFRLGVISHPAIDQFLNEVRNLK